MLSLKQQFEYPLAYITLTIRPLARCVGVTQPSASAGVSANPCVQECGPVPRETVAYVHSVRPIITFNVLLTTLQLSSGIRGFSNTSHLAQYAQRKHHVE
jgi:hypothetical protein